VTLFFALFLVAYSNTVTVETSCGPVVGTVNSAGTNVFLGIPFGEQRRFEHSTPARCWEGTFNATTLGPACWTFPPLPPQGVSEDCLNLNIYTPRLPRKGAHHDDDDEHSLLPVIFFVHGGSNILASNSDFAMETLADLYGDVVIVVPNYRLGTLGYLVYPELGYNGNYGVGDVITALRYIRPKLAAFGGDASRLTVMGQSSGGTNLLALLAAPSAKGLFQALISMSGSPNITMTRDYCAEQQAQYLLPLIDCSGDKDEFRACLKTSSAENLTNAMGPISGNPPSISPPYLPTAVGGDGTIGLVIVDGEIVTKPLLDALREPVIDVPLLIQNVQCELDPTNPAVDALTSISNYQTWITQYLTSVGFAADAGTKVVEAYRDLLEVSIESGFETWNADLSVTCGNDLIASTAISSFRSPVYRTRVLAAPSHTVIETADPYMLPGDKNYAFHMWDLPISAIHQWGPFVPEPSDIALGAAIRKIWHDIAYTGRVHGANPGLCTAIVKDGHLEPCPESKCPALEEIGFGQAFWWVN